MYLLLAGISARRWCLSVHTVVSFDFAVSIVPLWHATIFPPFFVAGAIFSGFAMVIVARRSRCGKWYELEDFITDQHMDICGKVMLGDRLAGLLRLLQRSSGWRWYSH